MNPDRRPEPRRLQEVKEPARESETGGTQCQALQVPAGRTDPAILSVHP